MSRHSEFLQACLPYQDVNGYMGGHPTATGLGRNSDNAVMFTAEYLRIAYDLDPNVDVPNKVKDFMDSTGRMHDYPDDVNIDTSPDNYLGFLNYCSMYESRQSQANQLLLTGAKNFGVYTIPKTLDGFMWRQPQLIGAALSASGRLSWWKLYYLPIVLYTAGVIAVAGIGADPVADQDTRRLSWHLIQVMKDTSLLCRLAAILWWNRLRRQYGDVGMKLVFQRYFDEKHPFAQYAVNEWER